MFCQLTSSSAAVSSTASLSTGLFCQLQGYKKNNKSSGNKVLITLELTKPDDELVSWRNILEYFNVCFVPQRSNKARA